MQKDMKSVYSKKIKGLDIVWKTLNMMWRVSPKCFYAIFLLNFWIGLINPLITIVWSYFLNSLILLLEKQNFENAVIWLSIQTSLIFLLNLLNGICRLYKETLSDYMNKHITHVILSKTEAMKLIHFDNPKVYNQINKISNESLGRSISLLDSIAYMTQNLISLLGFTFIFSSYNKLIVLLSFFIYVPIYLVNTRIASKLHDIFNERIENLRLIDSLQSLLLKYENIKEIKLFGVSKFLRSRIAETQQNYIDKDIVVKKSNLQKKSLISLLEGLTLFLFEIYIVIDGVRKHFDVGDTVMYLNSIENLMRNIQNLMQAVSYMYQNNLYIQTLFEFIQTEYEIEETDKIKINSDFNKIKFEHVYFKYPNTEDYVLEDINIELDASKSYLLVGLNGSGKTTLVKLLTKLYKPTKGKIFYNGIDIKDLNTESYWKNIGVVFQDFIKYPLDVEANIKLGNYGDFQSDLKMYEAAKNSGASEFIERLPNKYKTVLQKEWTNGTELSLGEWQKIAISRAYFSDASIIIMDEPAASLDAIAENDLYLGISQIIGKKTCIMISHRFTTAKLADYIIVLENHTVCEFGTFNKLMADNGHFAKLYNLQAKKYGEEI